MGHGRLLHANVCNRRLEVRHPVPDEPVQMHFLADLGLLAVIELGHSPLRLAVRQGPHEQHRDHQAAVLARACAASLLPSLAPLDTLEAGGMRCGPFGGCFWPAGACCVCGCPGAPCCGWAAAATICARAICCIASKFTSSPRPGQFSASPSWLSHAFQLNQGNCI